MSDAPPRFFPGISHARQSPAASRIRNHRINAWKLALRGVVIGAIAYYLPTSVGHPCLGQDAKQNETKQDQAGSSASDSETGFGNVYCGPRCVQRVLREYGAEVELIELIREMQWPDVEQGSTLAALSAALHKRGVSTKAVDLDPKFDIEWTQPAIVHLEKGGVAHFVVWLPPTEADSSGRVWDNDLTDAVKRGQFDGLRTGPVLLTANEPIAESAVVGRRTRLPGKANYLKATLPWALGIVGFACGWFLQRHFSGNRKRS